MATNTDNRDSIKMLRTLEDYADLLRIKALHLIVMQTPNGELHGHAVNIERQATRLHQDLIKLNNAIEDGTI